MKKCCCLFLTLCMTISICACSAVDPTYTQPNDSSFSQEMQSSPSKEHLSEGSHGESLEASSPSVSNETPIVDPLKPVFKEEDLEKFEGEEIRFLVYDAADNLRSIATGEGDDPSATVNIALKQRNEKVEKELGIKISTECYTWQSLPAEVLLLCKSAKYDVVVMNAARDLVPLGVKGNFYDLSALSQDSYLNPQAPWWDDVLFEATAYKGTNRFITGDLNLTYTADLGVTYVNARLWESYAKEIEASPFANGLSDPYELVKNGYRTLDLIAELARILEADEKQNGEVDLLLSYGEQMINTTVDRLLAGSGFVLSNLTQNGELQSTFTAEENAKKLAKMCALLSTEQVEVHSYSADNTILNQFAKGKTLLAIGSIFEAQGDLTEMKDDFYVLPLPLFDHAQFSIDDPALGYRSAPCNEQYCQFAIFKGETDEKLPAITAALELMGYYTHKDVLPVYYDYFLNGKYSNDQQTREMITLIRNGRYADFSKAFGNEAGMQTYMEFRLTCLHERKFSSETLKGLSRSLEAKYLMPFYEDYLNE